MAAPGTSSVPAPTAGNAEKLEIAKRLALRINAQKNLGIESQVLSNLFWVLVNTFCKFFDLNAFQELCWQKWITSSLDVELVRV